MRAAAGGPGSSAGGHVRGAAAEGPGRVGGAPFQPRPPPRAPEGIEADGGTRSPSGGNPAKAARTPSARDANGDEGCGRVLVCGFLTTPGPRSLPSCWWCPDAPGVCFQGLTFVTKSFTTGSLRSVVKLS